ncbi:MAG: hypothetical protein AB8U25_00660 [Rickettsiales endosymbiont of Dermacentor nuttalli]
MITIIFKTAVHNLLSGNRENFTTNIQLEEDLKELHNILIPAQNLNNFYKEFIHNRTTL